jgi:hypothetical protein
MRLHPIRRPRDIPVLLGLTEPRRSFTPVLGGIVLAVIFQLSAPDTEADRLISVLLQAWVVLMAMRAAGTKARLRNAGAGTVAVLVVAALVAELIGDAGPAVARLISLALILVTPLAVIGGVVRELDEDKRVTVQTVVCGLCLYLLLGMAFSFLFAAIEDIGGNPFFANVPPGGVVQPTGSPNDFLYYSLATLTTTGYGDFSAATELGRAMSVVEALIGQIYLVTVLAVIVSNVRRRRPLDGT